MWHPFLELIDRDELPLRTFGSKSRGFLNHLREVFENGSGNVGRLGIPFLRQNLSYTHPPLMRLSRQSKKHSNTTEYLNNCDGLLILSNVHDTRPDDRFLPRRIFEEKLAHQAF